jgi:CheY-like chemotaxis protein
MNQKHVLIVEDDGDIRENLRDLFESENYIVSEAENGLSALQLLKEGKLVPNIILLDLMMPVMDGRTFIGEIYNLPNFNNVPIIVISAAVEKIDGKIAAFMKKPLDIEEVLNAVEKYAL